MSYTVLARKFRSQTFDEIVGQDVITTTLRNAIAEDRVHHGYLFCGTRGVGKTSMARILAKALNCLSSDGPTVTPCGTCDSCVSITRGEDVDVIEIDAASNTGVDNIRELRSNAIYRPARSRFKIYIIDEVHMLSTGAFNALLKTLEEPPDHVKFIFATTELQKVPATILSRVQRFDFKTIPAEQIAGQLTRICQEEDAAAEPAALKRLARLANGSMRDALSLLDQVLSMGGGKVTDQILNELFPPAHDELFAALIDRLAASDTSGALGVADRSLAQGYTLDYWCTLLIGQIRDLLVVRVCGPETELVDAPAALRPKLAEQARQFDAGAFVYMISVLEELRRSVKSSGSGRALVEAGIVRLAEAAKFASIESLLERVAGAGEARPVVAAASAPRPAEALPAPDAKKNGWTGGSPGAEQRLTYRPAPVTQRAADRPAPVTQHSADRPEVRPAAPAAGAASAEAGQIARRMTQADLKAAHAEPMVKAALDAMGGQIVHVQRGAGARPAAEAGGEQPAAAERAES